MRKIRIGNDIRLKLTIKPNNAPEFSGMNEFDQSNIKQLRCYLINTSFCDCCHKKEKKCCKNFHQRIGFPDFYQPTSYNINNCGFPSYHMAPANMCNYHFFSPDFHDFHWWPGYRGFGIHPEHFHDWCHHPHWHGTKPSHYCHGHGMFPPHFCGVGPCTPDCCGFDPMMHPAQPGPCPCDAPMFPDQIPADLFGKEEVMFNHPHCYEPYYLADSWVLNEKNTLQCFFPAVQQKMCGTYKLIVVLTVFEQGWGRHNLRTYTIDKGDVFELVDDNTGESGDINIDVDSTGSRENVFASIYAEYDNYLQATNSDIPIGGFDLEDKQYNIYLTLKDGSLVMFNPMNWAFTQLKFTSSDEKTLTVGKDGTLHAHDWEDKDENGNTITYKDVTITVTDIDGQVPEYTFTVRVKKIDTFKMGFDPQSNHVAVDSTSENFKDYDVKDISHTVPNAVDGYYLWIFSQRRIHYVKSIEPERDLVSELSSGIRVPMMNAVIKDGYFCYRSVSPILSGNMNIKIKFA